MVTSVEAASLPGTLAFSIELSLGIQIHPGQGPRWHSNFGEVFKALVLAKSQCGKLDRKIRLAMTKVWCIRRAINWSSHYLFTFISPA